MLSPEPGPTHEIGVASEIIAESVLRMLRIECRRPNSWIELENEFFHSLAGADNCPRIAFPVICGSRL